MNTDVLKANGFTKMTDTPAGESAGIHAGDLLSYVMSHLRQDEVWVTIMKNVNVAAVASLCDAAAVVVADGVVPDRELIAKAQENGISLFTTELPAAEAVVRINSLMAAD